MPPRRRNWPSSTGRLLGASLVFLRDRDSALEDQRPIGEALKGSKLGDFWKYRVGDYRLIANIEDGKLRILVVRIGNRREVYKQR